MNKFWTIITGCVALAGCAPNAFVTGESSYNGGVPMTRSERIAETIDPSFEKHSIDLVRLLSNDLGDVLKKTSQKNAMTLAQESVRESMLDPSAAQFRNVRIVNFESGKIICGEVNGKNAYGAYTGYRPFAATAHAYSIYDPTFSDNPSTTRAYNAGVIKACSR